MTEHTKGPWQAKAGMGRWNVTTVAGPRTFNICSINTDRTEQEANARLIACAPELLLFAEWLLEAYHSDEGMPEAKEIAKDARALIAKATGAA